VVAAESDNQIGGQVLLVDLGGAVPTGVAVLAQHVAGPLIGGVADNDMSPD